MELVHLPAWNSKCRKTSKILGLNSIHSARKGKPGKQPDAQHPTFENLQHYLCLLMTFKNRCNVLELKETEYPAILCRLPRSSLSFLSQRGEHKQVNP